MKGKLFEGLDFSALEEIELIDEGHKATARAGVGQFLLSSIIEDPAQPRREFDEAKLAELADSIRERGVLQAVTLRPANADGKYVIVMGARRYRASLLAGKETIPAVIRQDASDRYDQMIENIQREALSHHDIAAFIRDELAKGAKKSAIAKSLGKSSAWMTAYVDFFDMDPAIQARIEDYGTRTAYELHTAMQIDADATRAFMASGETITTRTASAFRQSLKAGQGGSLFATVAEGSSDGAAIPSPNAAPVETAPRSSASVPSPEVETDASSDPVAEKGSANVSDKDRALARSQPARSEAVSLDFLVRVGDRIGRLLLDREAKQGSGYGVVLFEDGAEEVRVSDLAIIEIVKAQGKESDDA